MKLKVSGTTQWKHTADPVTGGERNENAAEGLYAASDWKAFGKDAEPVTADSATKLTKVSAKEAPKEQPKNQSKDWRLGLANKLPTGTEPQKDDDAEYGI